MSVGLQTVHAICNAAGARLALGSPPLTKAWVYENNVAVFDYALNGRPIAFDVTRLQDGYLLVDVFARNASGGDRFKAMGLKQAPNGHFILGVLKGDPSEAVEIEQICDAITTALRVFAKWERPSGDETLLSLLGDVAPIVLVDVGANYLSEPPYAKLLDAGLCKVIGFEPQREAFEILQKQKKDHETYFPVAVGAPGTVDLNVYAYSGFTSAYKIDERTIGVAKSWFGQTRLRDRVQIECMALDEVNGLPPFDVLKIDVQGGELAVFQNARRSLASALCVISEVAFFPLYENAPTFADVHNELLSQGFLLHRFLHLAHVAVSESCGEPGRGKGGRSQIIDGDAVYLRDYRDFDSLSVETMRKLALLGHFVFDSKDLAVKMLESLTGRGATAGDAVGRYVASLD